MNPLSLSHQNQPKKKVIDFRALTQPNEGIYICEYCDKRLLPYYDIKGERLTTGSLWQCPKCGEVKDTSMDNLKHPEQVITKASQQLQTPVFINISQPPKVNPPPFDTDKGDDQMLKGQGFHIVHTRITVNGRVVRNE